MTQRQKTNVGPVIIAILTIVGYSVESFCHFIGRCLRISQSIAHRGPHRGGKSQHLTVGFREIGQVSVVLISSIYNSTLQALRPLRLCVENPRSPRHPRSNVLCPHVNTGKLIASSFPQFTVMLFKLTDYRIAEIPNINRC